MNIKFAKPALKSSDIPTNDELMAPPSRRMDYNIKNGLYVSAGVREYWIVEPEIERSAVYHYEADNAPTIYTFSQTVPVGIFSGLSINIAERLK